MRLPWADCPLTAIDLVDNIPDAGVPELDWLATNEGKIVKLVGQWWDTLSEEEQRIFLLDEETRIRERLDLITEALQDMTQDTGI
jgi:hypothetical protein